MKQKITLLAGKSLSMVLFLGLLLMGSQSFGQFRPASIQDQVVSPNHTMEVGPGVVPRPGTPNHDRALWDIQFDIAVNDSFGGFGALAGAEFTGTEFWVSKWNSDTLARFDVNGSLLEIFTIPGVAGTRGIAWDGTSIYLGNNTTTLYQINPVTKAIQGTINIPAAARQLAYDPTLGGGLGGFWIGNWGTDIVGVNMVGTTLTTIAAATHGLGGMYGSAVDTFSTGGPYLWVFHQAGNPSNGVLTQLSLPLGTPTGVSHDVAADFDPTGLAGGVFVSDQIVPGFVTLGGLLQGDDLFGYELSDPVFLSDDVGIESTGYGTEYPFTPLPHVQVMNFSGDVRNNGLNGAANVKLTSAVELLGVPQVTVADSIPTLASFSTASIYIANGWTPSSMGTYDAIYDVSMTAADLDATNDIDTVQFTVTDTVYGRDNGIVTGALSISVPPNAASGILGQEFDVITPDTLTSMTFVVTNATAGDTLRGVVYSMAPITPSIPFMEIATTANFIVPVTGPGEYTLQIVGGGIPLAPGAYLVGIEEAFTASTTLGTAISVFTEDRTWVFLNGSWGNSEDFGFDVAYVLRANFGNGTGLVSVDPKSVLDNHVTIFPSPTNGADLNILLGSDMIEDATVTVYNLVGQEIATAKGGGITNQTLTLDMANVAEGIYVVEVATPDARITRKIKVTK